MAMQFSGQTSEAGMRYLRCEVSGHVDLEQAEEFAAYVKSPEWHHGFVLCTVAKGTEYTPDARKLFPTLKFDVGALATVVTSPILKAAINMMERLGRMHDQSPQRVFNSEPEALAWLEAQAASRRS